MGADHTAGSAATYIPNLTPEQQTDYSLAVTCTCDCFMCLFPWAAVNFNPEAKTAICRMAGILQGLPEGPGPEMVDQNGGSILALEYAWNEKAGIHHEDDMFYGGRDNYMYNVPHEATKAAFRSVQDGPLPAPPQPPQQPAPAKE